MARSENNEVHGSGNVPAAPAGAARGGGGRGEATSGTGAGRGGAVGGAAAAVGGDGADDGRGLWGVSVPGGGQQLPLGWHHRLTLAFPNDYPYKPPKVRFDTPCFHPNVDTHGNICLDILQDKWSSAYDVRTILLSIQSLLGEPNKDSPLNTQAAKLWANQEEFRKMVEKHYKPA